MIEQIEITSLSGRGSVTMRTRDYYGYWLGPVDWGSVEGQHQTYSYYNQIGESIVSTAALPRALTITGWVIDAGIGTLQTRCDFLNRFISPVEDYSLEYNGKKIHFRPDSSIKYSPARRENNKLIRKFLIQATCPYPLFTDTADTEVTFDSSGKMFCFPTDWGQSQPIAFAVIGKAYNKEVNNVGSFQTGIVARIRFTGEVRNPRLKNLTTDKFIGVNRTFVSGERLEISTVLGGKYITLYTADGKTENIIKNRDYRTTWIQLEPGGNILAIDCDDLDQRGNMEITVSFTPLYLEVQ